jgi:hypothetical protein
MHYKDFYSHLVLENLQSNISDLYVAIDALNSHSSYDDEQVLPSKQPKMEDLWYEDGTNGFDIYVDRDGIQNAGPHNLHFFNNKDEYIGSCNLGKNGNSVIINTIGFTRNARGYGYGMEFYLWLLDDKKYSITSDKELSDGAAAIYKKLLKTHKGTVREDGRIIVYPKF